MENKDDDIEYQNYKKKLMESLDKMIAFDKQIAETRQKEYTTDELYKMVENTNEYMENIAKEIEYIENNLNENLIGDPTGNRTPN